MNQIKSLSVLLFMALAFNFSVQANGRNKTKKKTSNCRCQTKKTRNPIDDAPFVSKLTPPPRVNDRCPANNGRWVSFRLRSRPLELHQFQLIADRGETIHYCVGNEPQFLYKSQVYSLNIGATQNKTNSQSVQSGFCRPATSLVRAMPTYKPDPVAPPQNQNGNKDERVLLKVTFNEDGAIGLIEVRQSPSSLHSDAATEAARKIKFNPAFENGRSVCVTQEIEYQFQTSPVTQKTQIILEEPRDQTSFINTSRNMRFGWQPVSGAREYRLEIQRSFETRPDWWITVYDVVEKNTIRIFGFPEGDWGQWRVTALRSDGTMLAQSEWRRFGFKK